MKTKITTLLLLLTVINITVFSQQLITQGSVWKYLDDGTDQGTNWRETGFDDSSWQQGNAQLGFGDGDEATVINSNGITYYFRQSFNVSDPNAQTGLKIELLRDDGAVVYINGTEVLRSNMPSGTITYTTTASHTVGGADEDTFFEFNIPATSLVQGNNLIAVEIHQRNSSSSDVSFDMRMEFEEYVVNLFRKNPYALYTGENSKMLLMWQLSQSETCEISWGEDNTYSTGTQTVNEYGNDFQYKIFLENLTPETKYYYKVSCNNEDFESNFVTGNNNSNTSFSFYAYGDTRSQPAEHNSVAQQILNKITDDPASQTFIFNSGDLVANGEDENDWDNQFFDPQYTYINELLSSLPYIAAIGNHEGNGTLYAKYFPYPMYDNTGSTYFSFDNANVHFIIIDQFTNYSVGSTQYNWIVDDLQNSDKPWKIAVFHKPGWSAGGHSNDTEVQNILQPLFEQYDVSIVINGHNHYYSRAVVNGIHHITTGGGGAPLYDPNSNYPNIVKVDKSYHFLKIDISNNNLLTISVFRNNGSIIETIIIDKTTGIKIPKDNPDNLFKIYKKQNDIITVENTDNINADIKIYDIVGKTIYSGKLKSGINIFKSKKGIHIVKISKNGKILLVKKI